MDRKLFAIIPIAFLILYSILFPVHEGTDYSVSPLHQVSASHGDSDDILAFRYGGQIGYADASGGIVYSEPVRDHIVFNDHFFINMNDGDPSMTIRNNYGNIVNTISTDGVPRMTSNSLFVMKNGGKVLRQIDMTGAEISRYTSLSPVTALETSDYDIIGGFLDGKLAVKNLRENSFSILSCDTDSKYDIIYSASISDDSRYIAVVAGLYPRYLLLFQKKQEEYRPVARYILSDSVRKSVFMKFTDSALFYEDEDGLTSVSLKTQKRSLLGFQGDLMAVSCENDTDYISVISRNGDDMFLNIYLKNGGLLFRGNYHGTDAFVRQWKDRLFTGYGSSLVMADISRRPAGSRK
ncbi:MAG: hypothetical protein MJ215_05210 [Spirochaetia bacterium]|nr:hypothetical protein [Spirochaetia bacterium]